MIHDSVIDACHLINDSMGYLSAAVSNPAKQCSWIFPGTWRYDQLVERVVSLFRSVAVRAKHLVKLNIAFYEQHRAS